ncbi:SAM-dependent methyltransferase [Paracoccus sp. (in: a-proteobacteria)]
MKTSQFFIVNAGAGAHDNITLRGYRILQQADLVIASDSQRKRFADELAGKQVIDGGHGLFDDLALRRLDPDEAARQQDAIRQRIEAAHAEGQTIVLLESGDAALFSPYRGYLTAFRHLQPELVPGVSSFNAGNAALAQSLLHDQNQRLQLSGLAAFMEAGRNCLPDSWVLFCMGLDLPRLIDKARELYPADTAMALVLNAGYPDCEVIRCSVGDLDRLADREIAFPYCLIYIGLDDRS